MRDRVGYSDEGMARIMGLSAAALAEAEAARARMEAAKPVDKRAVICACGHPLGKHQEHVGRVKCRHGNGYGCACTERVPAMRAPNARAFSFRTDENGHAMAKGIAKTVELGKADQLDWETTCVDCDKEPVLVVMPEPGRNEPRCEVHK